MTFFTRWPTPKVGEHAIIEKSGGMQSLARVRGVLMPMSDFTTAKPRLSVEGYSRTLPHCDDSHEGVCWHEWPVCDLV
jgi:hypothetical protein